MDSYRLIVNFLSERQECQGRSTKRYISNVNRLRNTDVSQEDFRNSHRQTKKFTDRAHWDDSTRELRRNFNDGAFFNSKHYCDDPATSAGSLISEEKNIVMTVTTAEKRK